ncbi:hypothetical protein JZU68_10370, partial [bacterium]|nr:hypothetical protein [bacterium]
GVGVGSAIITATTHDGWKTTSSEVTVTPAPVNKTISNCDTNVGWTSANSLTVFSSDKKEGLACLQSVGSSTDDFKLLLSTPINTGATIETDNLQFWYYVADNTLL